MRNALLFLFTFLFTFGAPAQRDLTYRKKNSKVFGGARDFSNYRPYGIQFSIGPNYTFTKMKNETISPDSTYQGQRFRYNQDPAGRAGLYAEVGMAHYPMASPKILLFGNRLLSYVDWGLGVRIHGGKEETIVQKTDASGTNVISEETGKGEFYNINGSARFAAHFNYYFPNNIHFIDNGLGVNGNYRSLARDSLNQSYNGIHFPETQRFNNNLDVLLHYDIAFGWKMRRGYYIMVGPQIPILGLYEWKGGSPKIDWFSSKYYPVTLKVKFIWLFKQKSNGCNTGSDEDKKREKEYQQNR